MRWSSVSVDVKRLRKGFDVRRSPTLTKQDLFAVQFSINYAWDLARTFPAQRNHCHHIRLWATAYRDCQRSIIDQRLIWKNSSDRSILHGHLDPYEIPSEMLPKSSKQMYVAEMYLGLVRWGAGWGYSQICCWIHDQRRCSYAIVIMEEISLWSTINQYWWDICGPVLYPQPGFRNSIQREPVRYRHQFSTVDVYKFRLCRRGHSRLKRPALADAAATALGNAVLIEGLLTNASNLSIDRDTGSSVIRGDEMALWASCLYCAGLSSNRSWSQRPEKLHYVEIDYKFCCP